jgi:hypothetical protein
MTRLAAILLLSATCLPLGAQQDNCCGTDAASTQMAPPATAGKPIEVSGTVGQIRIVAGQGMPYFELKHGAENILVYLGPMPFLIAENFNPKTGQEVGVKGYKVEGGILAAQITLVSEKRTIKFRDERGWPVWRGGYGRGRGR